MSRDSKPWFAALSRPSTQRGLMWTALAAALAWSAWLACACAFGTRVTDGVRTWSDADSASARAAVWADAEPLALSLPEGLRVLSAAPSPDRAWLVLALADEHGASDLYLAPLDRATGLVRAAPRALTPLNSDARDEAPAWSEGALWFASDRAGGAGGLDIWRARKGRTHWEDLRAVRALNSPHDDTDPAPSASGAECAFASNRPRDAHAQTADFDVWYARSTDDDAACETTAAAGAAADTDAPTDAAALDADGAASADPAPSCVRVDTLCTRADERDVVLGADARSLWLASNRSGDYELYRARFAAGTWSDAEHVSALGTRADERAPKPDRDGFEVCFTRAASSDAGDAPAPSRADPDSNDSTLRERAAHSTGPELLRARSVELWRVPRGLSWIDAAVLATLLAIALLCLLARRGGAFDTLYRWGVVSLLVHLIALLAMQYVFLEGRLLEPADDEPIEIRLLDESEPLEPREDAPLLELEPPLEARALPTQPLDGRVAEAGDARSADAPAADARATDERVMDERATDAAARDAAPSNVAVANDADAQSSAATAARIAANRNEPTRTTTAVPDDARRNTVRPPNAPTAAEPHDALTASVPAVPRVLTRPPAPRADAQPAHEPVAELVPRVAERARADVHAPDRTEPATIASADPSTLSLPNDAAAVDARPPRSATTAAERAIDDASNVRAQPEPAPRIARPVAIPDTRSPSTDAASAAEPELATALAPRAAAHPEHADSAVLEPTSRDDTSRGITSRDEAAELGAASPAPLALLAQPAPELAQPRAVAPTPRRATRTSDSTTSSALDDAPATLARPQRRVDEPAAALAATSAAIAPSANDARRPARASELRARSDAAARDGTADASAADAPALALAATAPSAPQAPSASLPRGDDASPRRESAGTHALALRDEPVAHALSADRPAPAAATSRAEAGDSNAGGPSDDATAPSTSARQQRPGGTALARRESESARPERAPTPPSLALGDAQARGTGVDADAANASPARAAAPLAQRSSSAAGVPGATDGDGRAASSTPFARPSAPARGDERGDDDASGGVSARSLADAAPARSTRSSSGGDSRAPRGSDVEPRASSRGDGAAGAADAPALGALAAAAESDTSTEPARGSTARAQRSSAREPGSLGGAPLRDEPLATPARPAPIGGSNAAPNGGDDELAAAAAPAAARPGAARASEPLAAASPRAGSSTDDARGTPAPPAFALPDTGPTRAPLAERPTPGRLDATPYRSRFGDAKRDALEQGGGNARTEAAVERGLAYLASIQHPSGLWGDGGELDAKYGDVRVGKTGLCLLAFLGAGHTPESGTAHSEVVARAIEALLSLQDRASGQFGASEAYGHGIATYALGEAYALTQETRLEVPLTRAVARILAAQQHASDRDLDGGWSYYYADSARTFDRWPRTAITAWQVMALESARLGGIAVPDAVFESAAGFVRRAFDEHGGYFRYNHDPQRTSSAWPTLPASTPAALFTLSLGGDALDAPQLDSAWQYVLARAPRRYAWEGDEAFVMRGAGNVYYWYYATLACFRRGGDTWRRWNLALQQTLLPAQARDGSWRPIDPYAEFARDDASDKSYTTAICVLCLEVYYRYFTPLLRVR